MLLAHDPVAGPDTLDDIRHGHMVRLLLVLELPVQALQRLFSLFIVQVNDTTIIIIIIVFEK